MLMKQPLRRTFGCDGRGDKERPGGCHVSSLILSPEVAHVTSSHNSLARTGHHPTQPQDNQEVLFYRMSRRENKRNS